MGCFAIFRDLWGWVMLTTAKKTLISGLIVCLGAFLTPVAAEEPGQDKTLQPLALNHAGLLALRRAQPALTGADIRLALVCRSITYTNDQPQNDYRPNIAHDCLQDARLTFYDRGNLPPGISPHATAICSILFGRDAQASNPQLGAFRYEGVVPVAEADIYEFWHFIINNVYPQSPPDADVLSASMGIEFEDWWTRGIEALAEHHGLIIVAGIGNGTNAHDPPLYPAAAANVIGVGVVDSVNTQDLAVRLTNFALAYPEHSTYGPTGNGRCKPDIVAPGNCLAADANEPNRYEPTGTWSSFSTPIVAGTIALLVQKARQHPELNAAVPAIGGNCPIKAIILNSATKLPFWHKGRLNTDDDHTAPLDHIQGAGMINALAAYRQLAAGPADPGNVPSTAWDNNILQRGTNPQNVYALTLAEPTGKFITATAVWNMHYSSIYPFEPLPQNNSDLCLELWAVDPNNPGSGYLLDYSDSSIDNVEHIYCRADPNYTNYELVMLINDADNESRAYPAQQYALAWSAADAHDNDEILWYDLNADGIVDKVDFTVLVNNWLASRETTDTYVFGDVNTDGTIDINDVEILLNHTDLRADWYVEQEDATK